MNKLKKAPALKSENEVLKFWDSHDSTDYVDWSKGKKALFPNLRPTSKPISIRFPVSLLNRIKYLANMRDIPYQTLIKIFVNRETEKEFKVTK
ncbi:MAG: BrnA antitoxin family protein [Candidatus Omnitrophota bacterium]|nr:BrnA antitoxin family protein [Candidatus Omnitrophota bacterium]